MARRFRSVQVKIVSAVLVVMILGIAAAILVSTGNQRSNLLGATQNTLSVNTDMLNVTIRNLMLAGEAPVAVNTIAGLRNLPAFTRFEIYRSDGSTAFNDFSTLEFVNRYQDLVMFDRTERVDFSQVEDPGFQEVLATKTPVSMLDTESREMEYWFPILNYAECRVCHGEENFIRGVSHFRISLDGVYGQVRQAGITLSSFLAGLGLILFLGILALVRRMILAPVLAIGATAGAVAQGDLEARAQVRSRDELGELAQRVNKMISGLQERADLEIRSKVAETRLEESRKYLDNIKEGLLLLNTDRSISEQYSAYLADLFQRSELAGLPLVDLVYPDVQEKAVQREELERFLSFLFENTTADMDMLLSINPLDEVSLKAGNRDILVRADWMRIVEDGIVVNVMVIFEDLTDIAETRRQLESERKQRESELERIAAILKVGPAVFDGFLAEAEGSFLALADNLENLNDQDVVARSFRDIHSVKGTARYLAFSRMEELAHELENRLATRRDDNGDDATASTNAIATLLEDLDAEVTGTRRLIDKFRDFARPESQDKTSHLMVFHERVGSMVADIAAELEKEVAFRMETNLADIPELPAIQPALFHLLRNALDHGIEDPMERLAAGKESPAPLVLRLRRDDQALVIEVEDDGRGLDFEELERKGLESGMLKPGRHLPSQILRILFQPGFSSKDDADTISGRGVGLDAVRDDVKRLGGQISVKTVKGKGTRFVLTLPSSAKGDSLS